MASIDLMAFDQPAYNPGDLINLTIDYTPDTPSVVPTTFNATASITDASGNVVASSSAPFVINEAQATGDQVGVSDDDNHAWAKASDTGTVAVFTTSA